MAHDDHASHADAGPKEELEHNLALAEEWAGTFKILGDPTRLKLLSAIHFAGQFQYTVTELAEATEVRVATASAALRAMELNGTVKSQREGRSIHYGIADEHVHDLLHWIGTGHKHNH